MVDFAIEAVATAQAEIERLLPAQWNETGDREIEARPNWGLYRALDERGAGFLIGAREGGVLVGYMGVVCYPHVNATHETVATISTYYMREGPVRALALSRMLDFALQRLADRCVFRVDVETSAEHSAGRLWELKGFKMAKIGYSLKLKTRPEGKNA